MKKRSIPFLILLFCLGTLPPLAAAEIEARLTPKEALQRLLAGNELFVKDGTICPNKHQNRRAITVSKQRPFAIVLGCSDSRVPPELAFDQGIGDIFVIRVAGNVVGATELDSVDYSAIYNDSSIIVVLGHENCGAITAVLANNTKDIETVASLIKPAVDKNHSLIDATEANIRNSVMRIRQSAPIAKLISEGKIDVVGAYYDLNSGKVRILN
jgi:carbonic anhydrase